LELLAVHPRHLLPDYWAEPAALVVGLAVALVDTTQLG
jgi:hypothetical protein